MNETKLHQISIEILLSISGHAMFVWMACHWTAPFSFVTLSTTPEILNK